MDCGDLNGTEIQKGGDIYIYIYVCIYMTDSLFYTVETNIRL